MSIDVYYFTHYFNDEAYHFKVYDTGNSRVVECNGTDILPLSNDKFGFVTTKAISISSAFHSASETAAVLSTT